MSRDSNRLIMELDKYRREINREMINPTQEPIEVETLLPVVKLCARARADYMTFLFEIAAEETCSIENVEKLRQYRFAYEELVAAANALETVIKRGYVDVKEPDR